MTLKISYPSIFTNGVEERILYGTERFGTKWADVFNGERASRAYLSTAGTLTYAVDLGLGNTATADHMILSHAGTYTGFTDVGAFNSNTAINAGYGALNAITISSPSAVSKVGPRGEDYIAFGAMSTPARYYAVEFTSPPGALDVKMGKIYLGNGLDLGREPAYQFERVPLAKAVARNTGGGYDRNVSTEYVYRFQFEWERITDANTQAFFDHVAEGATRDRFFLYTTANHHILNNERLVHCKLKEARTDNSSQKSNYNTITAEFEEIVG